MAETPFSNQLLLQLLDDVCLTLDKADIPYAICGGVALSVWGEARTTFDVDLVVGVDPSEIDAMCAEFEKSPHFELDPSVTPMPRTTLVRIFQIDHQPTPSELLRADLLVFDEQLSSKIISRRRKGAFAGRDYWFCSPEDLIVLKLIAQRPRDRVDVLSVLETMGEELDQSYIDDGVRTAGKSDEWQELVSQWKNNP